MVGELGKVVVMNEEEIKKFVSVLKEVLFEKEVEEEEIKDSTWVDSFCDAIEGHSGIVRW